jgi:hypothetical protein
MINKFLAGKKKYSVFITTLLVAVVQMFVNDPGQAQELGDMIPMLAMVLSGIVYLIVEGMRDIQKEKTSTEFYKAQNSGFVTSPSNSTQNDVSAQLASSSTPTAQPADPPAESFDIEAFHKEVILIVKPKYTEVNPATIYYEARDKGTVTRCSHITQAIDYWDYLASLAYDANDYLRQKTETPQGSCQPRDPSFYVMQRDLKHTLNCKDDLEALAKSGIDWKKSLASPQQTLYLLGELAAEIMGR